MLELGIDIAQLDAEHVRGNAQHRSGIAGILGPAAQDQRFVIAGDHAFAAAIALHHRVRGEIGFIETADGLTLLAIHRARQLTDPGPGRPTGPAGEPPAGFLEGAPAGRHIVFLPIRQIGPGRRFQPGRQFHHRGGHRRADRGGRTDGANRAGLGRHRFFLARRFFLAERCRPGLRRLFPGEMRVTGSEQNQQQRGKPGQVTDGEPEEGLAFLHGFG